LAFGATIYCRSESLECLIPAEIINIVSDFRLSRDLPVIKYFMRLRRYRQIERQFVVAQFPYSALPAKPHYSFYIPALLGLEGFKTKIRFFLWFFH